MHALNKLKPGWQFYPTSEFSNFTAHWDNLNQHLYQAHPLLDTRFIQALLTHFGNPNILLAVYPENSDQKGNFLLVKPRNPLIWKTFLPSQAQIAPLLCTHPQALQTLFAGLPGSAISFDILCQDPLYSFPTHTLPHNSTHLHAVTVSIDLQGSFEGYWHQRSKKLQQNIRRYFNRIENHKINYSLRVISQAEELQLALVRYGDLESKSWKGKAGTAVHSTNIQGRFYSDVMRTFETSKQVEIVEFYLNDQLAASRLNIYNNNILITLKTTYSEQLAHLSPGRLLLYLMIKREFALKRVNSIEFYTNATPEQIGWSTGQRPIEHKTIYQSASAKWAQHSLHKVKSTFKAVINHAHKVPLKSGLQT